MPWAIITGNFLATLALAFPAYTVYIALPSMMAALGADLATMQWVLTASTMAQTVMMPMVGWLSNHFGTRKLFLGCLLLTLGGALGSGLAWNPGMLIACRILQGMGSGPLAPLVSVVVFEAFPVDKRGLALGLNSTNWAIGALLALPVGGYFIEMVSWRIIFFSGIPCGLLSLLLLWRALPHNEEKTPQHLDVHGLVTLVGFLVPLLFGVNQGSKQGWGTPWILGSFVLSLVCGLAFVRGTLRRSTPLLDLRLFCNRSFTLICLIRFVNHIGFSASNLLVALFIQTILHHSPWEASLVVLPSALAVAPVSLGIGWVIDRGAIRGLCLGGLLAASLATYFLAAATPTTSLAWLILLITIIRVGSEGVFAPLNYLSLRILPSHTARMGSGLLALVWSVGGALGNTATAMLLAQRRSAHIMAMSDGWYTKPEVLTWLLSPLLAPYTIARRARGRDLSTQDLLQYSLHRDPDVAAFQECFFITVAVYLLALLIALWLRTPPEPSGVANKATF